MARGAVTAKKQMARAGAHAARHELTMETLLERQEQLVDWLYEQDRMLAEKNLELQRLRQGAV